MYTHIYQQRLSASPKARRVTNSNPRCSILNPFDAGRSAAKYGQIRAALSRKPATTNEASILLKSFPNPVDAESNRANKIPDDISEISSVDEDRLKDSFITTSSASSCHEDQEYNQLSSSIDTLELSSNSPSQNGSQHQVRRELDAVQQSSFTKPYLSLTQASATSFDVGHGHGAAKTVAGLNKLREGIERRFLPAKPSGFAKVIDIKSFLLNFTSRGNGKETAGPSRVDASIGNGVNAGNGSNANNIPTPPKFWGTRPGNQGDDGDEDGNENDKPRGLARDCKGKQSQKKNSEIACPAAKADPFYNQNCLGLVFPNLAKVRQHLAAKHHFNVEGTPYLPGQVMHPNGWKEILSYLYPDQEIPSSDENYRPLLEVIRLRGEGPGQPDILSYVLRMMHSGHKDENHFLESIAQLEAIRSTSGSSNTQPLGEDPDYDMMSPENNDEPGSFEGLPNSPLQQETASATLLPTRPSVVTIPSHLQMLPNPANQVQPSPTSQIYHPTSAPDAMGDINPQYSLQTDLMHHTSRSAGPDNTHQIDSEPQIELGNTPSPDRYPHIIVYVMHRLLPLVYHVDEAPPFFEEWIRQCAYPEFSFRAYFVEWFYEYGPTQPIRFEDEENMWQVYHSLRENFPELDLYLRIQPRTSPS
ncbi:hypothetical protein TWF694_009878 [Orbilia ellipsospora]|uniref:C2H2-type domain-containing protein n=1 Tax=Orbilia ellipsospora TaxID=2528407 RepID=A0AAV9XIK8_9PEZI